MPELAAAARTRSSLEGQAGRPVSPRQLYQEPTHSRTHGPYSKGLHSSCNPFSISYNRIHTPLQRNLVVDAELRLDGFRGGDVVREAVALAVGKHPNRLDPMQRVQLPRRRKYSR